ncbi:cryptochrome/photolyase family protein [Salinisphaera sp. Q1T1-3]|uniref:cryptochrome/photolyase family protein n=1 Tax=Salinisphaera sp. Q1T1-3 TaxID=2321229 RepID=UPI000E710C37|nr:cryptochrome/photolyase family protein [Salinisphaera sp. Q1T1-3]RJS92656.1 cryptochrome/photolyase family protein [Salinisphaera sp. Q1T1-3]
MRNLVLILGDQLDKQLSALDDFDSSTDAVWMAENETEATHVWAHKQRLVLFFAAMRHYRDGLIDSGKTVHYHALEADARRDSGRNFADILTATLNGSRPERLVMTECGDDRVQRMIQQCATDNAVSLQVRPDRHFYCSLEAFDTWAAGRQSLVLEDFYREMRREHDVLMDGNQPAGEAWNFDQANREHFGKDGPGELPHVRRFRPDELTREVIGMVEARFPDHPGRLDSFDLPVTHGEAQTALRDFIDKRLPEFGPYQDALWSDLRFGYHSRLSAALNLHLLSPASCVAAAEKAYREGAAPINSVEGFIRQILGWREFVRGVYWREMPSYIERNALGADLPVPKAFWNGDTDMACIADAMTNVIEHGYAHHIQRLMVLGLFALVAGVHPRQFHDWHMAMYLDAIDWVSLPNALGMSQYGDGGILGTKPYCASGNYINKMSNHCKNCAFDYKQASGQNACPITTLYWDFLDRNLDVFRENRRMIFQVKNIEKKRDDSALMQAIRTQAARLKTRIRQQERI